jgi:hypothetical protein
MKESAKRTKKYQKIADQERRVPNKKDSIIRPEMGF